MVSNNQIKFATEVAVRNSFFRYFFSREPVETKHILLSRLYPSESVTGSAIVGLQTSLGTTLWENLAKNLATLNGFEVLDPKVVLQKPASIPRKAENLLGEWARKREESTKELSLSEFSKLMKKVVTDSPKVKNFTKLGKGSGADLYFVKNGIKYVFDVKTVQINAGGGTKFNRTLMEWLTFDLFQNGSQSKMFVGLVIPYDPTENGDWWKLFQGRVAPLSHSDVLVGSEFWDFVTGNKNSLKVITDTFADLVKSQFGKHYSQYLTDYSMIAIVKHVEFQFNCKILEKSKSLDKKVKYKWQCAICGDISSVSMNKIYAQNKVCANEKCGQSKFS
jgi:hypothetical protein